MTLFSKPTVQFKWTGHNIKDLSWAKDIASINMDGNIIVLSPKNANCEIILHIGARIKYNRLDKSWLVS